MALDHLLTLADAAAELGVSASTLRHQASAGRLEAKAFGKTWITTRQEIERYRREHLNQRGRPLESVSIPWPGNEAKHPRLFVSFDGLSSRDRRRIVDELREILAGGGIWQLAQAPARMIAVDPGHRWRVSEDSARPSLHFYLSEPPATVPEADVPVTDGRAPIPQ